jgi:hypothetical protein
VFWNFGGGGVKSRGKIEAWAKRNLEKTMNSNLVRTILVPVRT